MIYSKKDRTVDAPKGHLFSEFLEDKCPFLDLIPKSTEPLDNGRSFLQS